jgi:hypothetical protein
VALNAILKRAAMMHTDIAVIAPPEGSGEDVVVVTDGRFDGYADTARHWSFARALLSELRPEPRSDPFVLRWYRAAATVMHAGARWSDLEGLLGEGGDLFPRDPWLLFFRGALNESLASPRLQTAVPAMPADVKLRLGHPSTLLREAEKFFRRSLEQEPAFAEARIHLGRVLALQGHHAEAAGELRRGGTETGEPLLLYYAELFLASEEQALSHPEAAGRHYERAAMYWPGAQAPHLGLSILARRQGDRHRASSLLPILERTASENSIDPWCDYPLAAGRNHLALLDELRAVFERPVG